MLYYGAVHLCSIKNVVDRLPDDMDNDNGNVKNTEKRKNKIKLYFMDNMRLRSRKINDFVFCLKGLSFNYESLINGEMKQFFDIKSIEEKYNISNIDTNSDNGIIEICKIIYDDLLSDILYQCAFHSSKEVYSNQQRQQLMNKLNDIIVYIQC